MNSEHNSQNPKCTCPSGNGSLVWPCPAHPPEAAHTDERLEMLIHEITGYEGEDDAYAYLRRALSELMEYRRVSDVAHAQQEAAPDDADEAAELLDSLIESIERHGNYSAEATLTFLNQIRQCLAASVAAVAPSDAKPYGWVQFIDGQQTQNFARDEAELATVKKIAAMCIKGGQTVEYVQVFDRPVAAPTTVPDHSEREAANAGGTDASPAYGIIDPDYARYYSIIRCTAWSYGYAIGMHGSFTRDLDLIMVPWTEEARDPAHVIKVIASRTDLRLQSETPSAKPHGRTAYTLHLPGFGDPRWIDLSIVPRQPPATIAAGQEAANAKDAARLNFLDTNARFKMGWKVGMAPVGNLSVQSIITGGLPIREAIDAAMAAAPSSEKGGAA